MELDLRTGHPDFAREPSTSIASWIAASNVEIQRIAHLLLEATIFLTEEQYDKAEQHANEARNLARKMGAKYHEAQACYLLASINLNIGRQDLSIKHVEELSVIANEEGYVGFLLRDPRRTGQLLANALHHSATRQQLITLIIKLSGLRTEVAAALLSDNGPQSADKSVATAKELRVNDPVSTEEQLNAALLLLKQPSKSEAIDVAKEQSDDGYLEIFFLGPVKVRRGGYQITDRAWRTSKAKELFAYLLAQSDRSAFRDELLEVLWPEQSVDAAVKNFHFTLHSLRRALEPHLPAGSRSSFLILSGRRYQLNLPSDTWVDVQEFKTRVANGSKLMQAKQENRALPLFEEAIELYQGDYLIDIYADWAERERQHLLRAYLSSLRQLAWSAYARQNYDQVIHYVGAVLSKDNYVEEAHRLLMQVACDTGNPAKALRQYDELATLLKNELGVQPEAATRQLHRQILEGRYQRLPL